MIRRSTQSAFAISTEALTPARTTDAALARGETKPLLGLPMTVKKSYNVAGLPTTWGLPPQKDFRPTEDALPITRVKDAGGVILGKTNVPVWHSVTGRATTTSMAPPITLTISAARRAARPADRRRRWRQAMVHSRSAPISAARCACRRFIAASLRTSDLRTGGAARPYTAAVSAAAVRPRSVGDRADGALGPPICRCCSTWSRGRIRWKPASPTGWRWGRRGTAR